MLRRLSSPRQFSTNPKTIPKTNTKAKAKAKDMVKAKAKPFRPNIENLYSKKTPIEHVLLRPGMYVGSVSPMPASTSHYFDPLSHRMKPWESLPLPLPLPSSLDEHSHSQMQKMQNQRPLIRPALLKIFDEILVNAADNYRRDPKGTTELDVNIDKVLGRISVRNNGAGIPVMVHGDHGVYLPELLFGHLLTGSNFEDDDENSNSNSNSNFNSNSSSNSKRNSKRNSKYSSALTGGRHGYGAKLTNIFSSSFTVTTRDCARGLDYTQSWSSNMSVMSPALTKANDGLGGDFTEVAFEPDLSRLGSMTDYDYKAMVTRVADVAGTNPNLRVTLNGELIDVDSFGSYCELYNDHDDNENDNDSDDDNDDVDNGKDDVNLGSITTLNLNPRWTLGLSLSPPNTGYRCISFVNSLSTPRGGTHVDALESQIINGVYSACVKASGRRGSSSRGGKSKSKSMSKKNTDSLPITRAMIKRRLSLYINALVENPSFDSQAKEHLTTPASLFGSSPLLKPSQLASLLSSTGLVPAILSDAESRQQATLSTEMAKIGTTRSSLARSIPKLDDANFAGLEGKAELCTLILTEGDSAKALAVSGIGILGRDTYGVFPLRGKLLNVRQATLGQVGRNEEVRSLVSIMGLEFGKSYEGEGGTKGLRYGKIMIMTDQDADGSHIKGLIINMFRHFWPSLLTRPEFLTMFITPLLKAAPLAGNKSRPKEFFTLNDYESWREGMTRQELQKKWKVKFYKGLGTSTGEEALGYFGDMEKHHKGFRWGGDGDGEKLDMVFSKELAAERRDWILSTYDQSTVLDLNKPDVTYTDFVDKELIHFSNSDNIRSLPSLVDGLKPSQRKVLYSCFKRKLFSEIKVAQLAGYVAEHSAYHHGEASLHSTITSMAQDYVGSNNVNLLTPNGQFGTRLSGGKDAASPRYIFTKLEKIARLVFPEVDDGLLERVEDDGMVVEPVVYVPVIPMVLVNGGQGIGTGWSTNIPSFDPKELCEVLERRLLEGKAGGGANELELTPHSRGFRGTITRDEAESESRCGMFVSCGVVKKLTTSTVEISELPIGKWTNDYKLTLIKMQERNEIKSFVDNSSTNKPNFIVKISKEKLIDFEQQQGGLEVAFALTSNLSYNNMNMFLDGVIVKVDSPDAVIEDFFPRRLDLYKKRREFLIREAQYDTVIAVNKRSFIEKVKEGEIELIVRKGKENRSKAEIVERLEELEFDCKDAIEDILEGGGEGGGGEGGVGDGDGEGGGGRGGITRFDYLLNLPLSSFTSENINRLEKEEKKNEMKLKEITKKSPEQLWLADLKALKMELD